VGETALVEIDSVEVVRSGAVPEQVFLRVTGWYPAICGGDREIGKTAVAVNGNDFAVSVYLKYFAPPKPGDVTFACIAIIEPFVRSIPLPVYGLDAGTYTYSVNGEHQGEFTLSENNVFAEDGFQPLPVINLSVLPAQ
jgi:hypothetical protein